MTKNSRVVVDTDAIYASLVDVDVHHNKAQALKRKSADLALYISDFVLGEAATLLSRRVGKPAADQFLQGYGDSGFTLVFATPKIISEATSFFLAQITKDSSFVDCVNMATAKTLLIETIFSFDRVYERNGFKLLG